VIKHFLPLGFCVALAVGLGFPLPGAWLAGFEFGGYKLAQSVCIVLIFIVSGLTLKTSEVTAAIKAWLAYTYGIIAILFLTPFAGLAILQIPFEEPAFGVGFAVFCSVPTTLTSGVTLVNQAAGNGALALMLTVTTNVLGVFTTPLMLALNLRVSGMSAETGTITFDTGALIVKLVATILAPTVFGKLVRESHHSVSDWVAGHKTLLSLTNNSLLICIVWMTISSGRDVIVAQPAEMIFLAIAVGIALHAVLLALNGAACWLLRLAPPERKAAHILGSQKTLPVSITVLSFLPPRLGNIGLLTIPCIIGHLSQLFTDAFLVSTGKFDRPFLFCGPRADTDADAGEEEEEEASSSSSPHGGQLLEETGAEDGRV